MTQDIWQSYQWFSLNDAAQYLGVEPKRVRSLVKDGSLPAIKPNADTPLRIAEPFMQNEQGEVGILESLKGTVTLLLDGGYDLEEAVTWLLSVEESLGQSPVAALQAGRKHEVRRIAAARAF